MTLLNFVAAPGIELTRIGSSAETSTGCSRGGVV